MVGCWFFRLALASEGQKEVENGRRRVGPYGNPFSVEADLCIGRFFWQLAALSRPDLARDVKMNIVYKEMTAVLGFTQAASFKSTKRGKTMSNVVWGLSAVSLLVIVCQFRSYFNSLHK